MKAFADELARARNGILVWSMGITQHAHGAETVKAIMNLALLRGYLGRAHHGRRPDPWPLSGVQGGAEIGAYATAFRRDPGQRGERERFSDMWGFPVPRSRRSTTEKVAACGKGEVSSSLRRRGTPRHAPAPPGREAARGGAVEDPPGHLPHLVHAPRAPGDLPSLPCAAALRAARRRHRDDDRAADRLLPEIPGHEIDEARTDGDPPGGRGARSPEEEALILFPRPRPCETRSASRPRLRGIETLRRLGDHVQRGGERLCEGGVCATPDGKVSPSALRPPETLVPEGRAPPRDASREAVELHGPGRAPIP